MLLELNKTEEEIIRRHRLSPEDRQAEDSARMASDRAQMLAYAAPEDRDRLLRIEALTLPQKHAYGLVCQYRRIMSSAKTASAALESLPADVAEVPAELLSVSAEPKTLESAPEVIEEPGIIQLALADPADEVPTPGVFKRVINSVFGRNA